eukprot:3340054-Pleurochrysis_carterae.AAC.1
MELIRVQSMTNQQDDNKPSQEMLGHTAAFAAPCTNSCINESRRDHSTQCFCRLAISCRARVQGGLCKRARTNVYECALNTA